MYDYVSASINLLTMFELYNCEVYFPPGYDGKVLNDLSTVVLVRIYNISRLWVRTSSKQLNLQLLFNNCLCQDIWSYNLEGILSLFPVVFA